jgi:predicted nucleic acid-binding protein
VARRGRPPLPRGIRSFEAPDWQPPEAILLDTTIVVDALLPAQKNHQACVAFFDAVAQSECTLVFNRLLETELCEVLFNIAGREQHGKDWKRARYDGRVRRRANRLLEEGLRAWAELLEVVTWTRLELSEVSDVAPILMGKYGFRSYDAVHAASLVVAEVADVATLDHGFTVLPEAEAMIHTTQARVPTMRKWRGGP